MVRWLGGLGFALLAGAATAGVGASLPGIPMMLGLGLAAALFVGGLTSWIPGVPRGVLWLSTLALPVALLALWEVSPEEMPGLRQMMSITAAGLLVDCTLGNTALWFFLGGPKHHGWPRWLPFVAAVAVADQLVDLGMQVVVPGLVFMGVFALVPLVAAQADEEASWSMDSILGIARAPLAWLLVVVGMGVSLAATSGLSVMWAGVDAWVTWWITPHLMPSTVRFATTALDIAVRGLFLMAAQGLYQRGLAARTGPGPSAAA